MRFPASSGDRCGYLSASLRRRSLNKDSKNRWYRPVAALAVMVVIGFTCCVLHPLVSAGTAGLSAVSIDQVAAVYDHMPGIDSSGDGLHVTVTVRFKNASNAPLPIRLERAYSSFDASKRGSELKNLSLADSRLCGAASKGCAQFILEPGQETGDVCISSSPLPREGQGDTVFVTVLFLVGGDAVELSGSGDVTSAD